MRRRVSLLGARGDVCAGRGRPGQNPETKRPVKLGTGGARTRGRPLPQRARGGRGGRPLTEGTQRGDSVGTSIENLKRITMLLVMSMNFTTCGTPAACEPPRIPRVDPDSTKRHWHANTGRRVSRSTRSEQYGGMSCSWVSVGAWERAWMRLLACPFAFSR